MTYDRRKFIHQGSKLAGLTALSAFAGINCSRSLDKALKQVAHLDAKSAAKDEDFWQQVRQNYTVSSTIINLNNGGISPQPQIVQEALAFSNRFANEIPSVNWQRFKIEHPLIKRKLADLAGCSVEELALQRNTTETMATIIYGLPLTKGDEVVLSKQDYPTVINAWKQRALREGIVLKWVDWQFPIEDKAAMVEQYTAAFTAKTKVAHLTHVINWNGQFIPVAEIGAIAQARGIEVVVDAAHSFAQFDFKFSALNCDYLGTSLHKWLSAPFGNGLLYVKKDKINKLFPLFATEDPYSATIDKFEALGTISMPNKMAIAPAIDFHNSIGIDRKFERLHYLKNYWMDRIKDLKGVQLHTSQNPEFSGAIGLFSIENMDSKKFYQDIYVKYRIHTIAINRANIEGIRITPNVYTITKELDLLIQAISNYVKA